MSPTAKRWEPTGKPTYGPMEDTGRVDAKSASKGSDAGRGDIDYKSTKSGGRAEGKGGDARGEVASSKGSGSGRGDTGAKSAKSGGARAEDSKESTHRVSQKSKERGRLDDPYNDPDLGENSADVGADEML
jgi:hypothetical protein